MARDMARKGRVSDKGKPNIGQPARRITTVHHLGHSLVPHAVVLDGWVEQLANGDGVKVLVDRSASEAAFGDGLLASLGKLPHPSVGQPKGVRGLMAWTLTRCGVGTAPSRVVSLPLPEVP